MTITRRSLVTSAVTAGVGAAVAGAAPAVARERGPGHGSRPIVIRGGHVITADGGLGDIGIADVVIEDRRIASVGGRHHLRHGAQVIDATGTYVLPGYVNAHQHMWEAMVRGISYNATGRQHRDVVLDPLPGKVTPADIYYGTLLGALDMIDKGTTTGLNWDLMSQTLEHATAAVNALVDSGIRALHSFSASYTNQNDPDGPPHHDDILALAHLVRNRPLVSMHLGTRNPVGRGPEVEQRVVADVNLARRQGWTVSLHAGLLTSQATPALMDQLGLLGPDILFINGSAFTATEFQLLAQYGSWVITAPEVEQQSATPPPLREILAAGLRPVVCADSYAYTSSYMPDQLRILLQSAREKDILDGTMLTMEEVFPYGNINPAKALDMGDKIGSLAIGKEADIILVNRTEDLGTLGTVNAMADLLQMSDASNIDTVLIAGKVVKRRGELVGHDLSRLRRKVQKHQERLLS